MHGRLDTTACCLHLLDGMYLLTYKQDASVKMQSGIFVIIASSPCHKLFTVTIQCKQVSAHISFGLTALGLDHSDIQLLRELLLSLPTPQKEGGEGGETLPKLQSFQQLKALQPFTKVVPQGSVHNTVLVHLLHIHAGLHDVS